MIETLKAAALASPSATLSWGGLLIGVVFGLIVQRSNFCAMGAIADMRSFGDFKRFRAWLLACAVAMIGVAGLQAAGVAEFSTSLYQAPRLAWGGHVVGGLLFGFGMVFAGGCVSRNLVRAGGGDLRAGLALIVTGIFGYMSIGGLLAPLRVALVDPLSTDLTRLGMADQHVGTLLATLTGWESVTAPTALAVAAALLFYCLADTGFRASARHLGAGLGLGLCIVAGWALTGLTHDEFAAAPTLASLSFVRPTGETLDYLMRFTAFDAASFAVATTIGTVIGGFLGAAGRGQLRLSTFADTSDTLRNLFGAALMGVGGVLALGCTVGQALSGVSTLALGSVLTFVCIVIGGIAGVKTLETLA